MKLNPVEVRAAYFIAAAYRRAGLPATPSVRALYERLDWAIRTGQTVSPTRHQGRQTRRDSSRSEHVELVGARPAADMLGWHGPAGIRRIQRHAHNLGGQKVGNRLVFHADRIREYRDLTQGADQ